MLRAWKIYGIERSEWDERSKKLEYRNMKAWIFGEDITRTNEYIYIRVEAESESECEEFFKGFIKRKKYKEIKETYASCFGNDTEILVGGIYDICEITDVYAGDWEEALDAEVAVVGFDREDLPVFVSFEQLDEAPMIWKSKVLINDIW